MAMNTQAPARTNWWAWGGGALALVAAIAAIGYGLDWFGGGTADVIAPATEQAAPAAPEAAPPSQ